MGFTRAGISSGVTFSFLISSPLVDLGAFILLVSVFGFPIAITYVVVGLVLAVIGGTIIDGATGRNYNVPNTTDKGTYYYYCTVTASITGSSKTASATSDAVTVTVSADEATLPHNVKKYL